MEKTKRVVLVNEDDFFRATMDTVIDTYHSHDGEKVKTCLDILSNVLMNSRLIWRELTEDLVDCDDDERYMIEEEAFADAVKNVGLKGASLSKGSAPLILLEIAAMAVEQKIFSRLVGEDA